MIRNVRKTPLFPLLLMLLCCPVLADVSGSVVEITSDYGNINTDITGAALSSAGIGQGDRFTVSFGDKRFTVMLGTTYSDVDEGEWVGFILETGTLRLARNLENAAETMGCAKGDEVVVAALPSSE